MTSTLYAHIYTDKDLFDNQLVRDLMASWMNDLPDVWHPTHYDFGEPVRKPFAPTDYENALEAWLDAQVPPLFRRSKSPTFLLEFQGRRKKGKDPRDFPYSVRAFLKDRPQDVHLEEFLHLFISYLDAPFAFVCRAEAFERRHRITYETKIGTMEENVGRDLGETLPGIYWMTYLGEWALDRIGRDEFERLEVGKVRDFADGKLVIAYDDPALSGTEDGERIEEAIMEHLGRELFFDRDDVDIEALASRFG